MDFYSNLIILHQSGLHFGRKLTSFVVVMDQNTCVCGCTPVLYYSKVNSSLLGRFMKHQMGIMDTFLLQPCHFPPSQSLFWSKSESRPDYLEMSIQG